MNQEAQAELARILALSPADVTEAEHGFLQARRSYLTEEQRIKFGITETPETETAESAEEKPKKLAKK
jgi:hypothetical protein